MDAALVNPIIDATLKTLKTLAAIQANVQTPTAKSGPQAQGDVTGMIQFAGDVEGSVAVSYSAQCILHVVSQMFGEPMTELNDDVKDAVGEITNMICGQLNIALEGLGRNCKSSLATALSGSGHPIDHGDARPVVIVPIQTNVGSLAMEFAFGS